MFQKSIGFFFIPSIKTLIILAKENCLSMIKTLLRVSFQNANHLLSQLFLGHILLTKFINL